MFSMGKLIQNRHFFKWSKVMTYKTILLEQEEHVASLTLNRPEKLNSFNEQMCEELLYAIDQITKNRSIRVVVVSATGPTFSVGVDLDWLRSMTEQRRRGDAVYDITTWLTTFRNALGNMPQPSIASIGGTAVGWGVTFPLSCDLIITAEDIKMSLPFATGVGITPEMASTYMLPRLVGMNRACELLLTGKTITGKEAKEIGLVNDAVPSADLQTVTARLAKTIASAAPMAIQLTKKGLHQALDADFGKQLYWEDIALRATLQSEDHAEAVEAFFGKRKPVFKGK
jgi:enoyl-CoA hydratase/carnithine racemase